jgi:hypothetical protein
MFENKIIVIEEVQMLSIHIITEKNDFIVINMEEKIDTPLKEIVIYM